MRKQLFSLPRIINKYYFLIRKQQSIHFKSKHNDIRNKKNRRVSCNIKTLKTPKF